MDDGHMGDRELKDRWKIMTVGSERKGPSTVRSNGDARRIILGVIQHSKVMK
jgi:hypothetical protein